MIPLGTVVKVKPGTGKTTYERQLADKTGTIVGHGTNNTALNLMKFTDDEEGKHKHYFFEDEELEVLSNDRRPVSSE